MKRQLKKFFPIQLLKLYRLFPPADRLRLLVLFAMMLLAAVLEIAGIGIVPVFIAVVANPEGVKEYPMVGNVIAWLGIETSRELLIFGAWALIGVFLLKNLYLTFFYYYQTRFIFNRQFHFSKLLMQSYMQAPYTFHLGRNTSELLRNATQEVMIMVNQFMLPILKLAMDVILIAGVVIFLFIVEPIITIIVLLSLGLIAGGFLSYTAKKTKAYGKKAQGYRNAMIKTLTQGIGGIKDARVLNREPWFINAFSKQARGNSDAHQYQSFITQVPKPLIETLAVGGMLLIALIMLWQGRAVSSIIPVLTLFGMAIMRLMPAIREVMQFMTQLRYSVVAIDPIYDDIMELKPYGKAFREGRKSLERLSLETQINVNDLHYYYPNCEERALKGISFTIPRGSAVAFTGPSGAGKTTIADILLGLLDPQEGEVLVDGKNIFHNLPAWQRNIGYIPQFIYLADETLRENIAFGLPKEEIDEEKVVHAMKMAQLEELIGKLPEGLDTIIGEQGTRLSGGQRQRVGIARALYHDPQVLIMDEATSALDNLTEKYIVKAIEKLRGDRTVIMIAHRLTTVQNCDTIYFMQDGCISSAGSYAALLEQNNEFKKLAIG